MMFLKQKLCRSVAVQGLAEENELGIYENTHTKKTKKTKTEVPIPSFPFL